VSQNISTLISPRDVWIVADMSFFQKYEIFLLIKMFLVDLSDFLLLDLLEAAGRRHNEL